MNKNKTPVIIQKSRIQNVSNNLQTSTASINYKKPQNGIFDYVWVEKISPKKHKNVAAPLLFYLYTSDQHTTNHTITGDFSDDKAIIVLNSEPDIVSNLN